MPKPYTDEEIQFIVQNHGVMSYAEMAAKLPGRTPAAVNQICGKLISKGVLPPKKRHTVHWTEDEDRMLTDNYGRMTREQLAELFNGTDKTVYNINQRITQLGLRKSTCQPTRHVMHSPGDMLGPVKLLKKIPANERPGNRKQTRWLCLCPCGNEFTTSTDRLKPGPDGKFHTLSCGCYQNGTVYYKGRQQARANGCVDGTNLPLLRRTEPLRTNKLGQKNIHMRDGKYIVEFTIRRKRIHVGTFHELTAAINARDMFRKAIMPTLNDLDELRKTQLQKILEPFRRQFMTKQQPNHEDSADGIP